MDFLKKFQYFFGVSSKFSANFLDICGEAVNFLDYSDFSDKILDFYDQILSIS